MDLNTALTEIADFLSLDAQALIAYAAADDIGGFHFDPTQATFPGGSLWSVEGKVLYALVRALKPKNALELGTWHGASATHMLSAQLRNGYGALYSVDHWEGAGTLVPDGLRDWWHITYADAVAYIDGKTHRRSIDFCFEDAIHSESEVYAIVTALKPKLKPGAVVVHHDSEHGDDGRQVKAGVTRAGITNWKSWLISPSDCGLLIWVNE